MPATSTRTWLKRLRRAGFVKIRQTGGHSHFKCGSILIVVPAYRKDQKMNIVMQIRDAIRRAETESER